MRWTLKFAILGVLGCTMFVQHASAVQIVFTLQSNSTLVTSGSYNGTNFTPQSAGSNTAGVVGNFLADVEFDPNNPTVPTSIQFLPSSGYETLLNTKNGANFQPGNAPANAALTASGLAQVAVRGTTFTFSSTSSASPVTNGSFTPQLLATANSGEIDSTIFGAAQPPAFLVGSALLANTGGDALSYSNGTLSLTVNGSTTVVDASETGTFTGHLVAQASFTPASNVAIVDVPGGGVLPAQVSLLGGANQSGGPAGGVTVQLPATATSGTFTAQTVTPAGLPLAALQLAGNLGITAGSTGQFWNFTYSGAENGSVSNPITLTLAYDPSTLPLAYQQNPSLITVEHFNEITNSWEQIAGTVSNNTITIELTSLSFLGLYTPVYVPEPSTCTLVAVGLLTLAGAAWRRRVR